MKNSTLSLLFTALSIFTLTAQVSFIANDACFGTLTSMQASSGSTDTVSAWSWDFDEDGAYDDAWGQIANFIFDTIGPISVGVKVTFTNGSADSAYQNIIINPLPSVNFFVDNLCEGDPATFTDNSIITSGSIANYNWDFDGLGGDVGPVVQFQLGGPGVYLIILECKSAAGCKSSTSKQNEVHVKPNSEFITSGGANVGLETAFLNSSSILSGSIQLYVWDFGDGKGSSVQSPKHDYLSAQTYQVELVAISDQDCRDTSWMDVTIAEAPNIFEGLGIESEVVTPNADDINDMLKIRSLEWYSGCEVEVFDRWNQSVYSNDDYSNDDEAAAFTGADLDAGAYYYVIKCDDSEIVGVINILR